MRRRIAFSEENIDINLRSQHKNQTQTKQGKKMTTARERMKAIPKGKDYMTFPVGLHILINAKHHRSVHFERF
ncbi:hypothetical protein [Undibacterium oligocarboniphilum]|uniref:Uncharacterized protein n=1 Tax=Undibacterium oligocarboniphilum TaxID=666702 RepID=A0A850QNV6_9BURK|nr:hypothetical protein [Undibacterium oligocarboniphilum]MBC3870083.1 hypothetical protein [Undibacterium oligocarboniphilum]NVO78074.1 hypothetical protein [Undibacterium oligocarboniphilum]